MKLGNGSALKALMWSLSIGLFVTLGGISIGGCAGGDKDKDKGDEMANDDGDKKDKKKGKKKNKKKKKDDKPAAGDN